MDKDFYRTLAAIRIERIENAFEEIDRRIAEKN